MQPETLTITRQEFIGKIYVKNIKKIVMDPNPKPTEK
jgi:hypothetical protein